MTPEQQLHLARVLWPRDKWHIAPHDTIPWREAPEYDCPGCSDEPSTVPADLTSDEAVGRMVAYLWQSERYHSWSYLGDELGTYSDDWREALALLVLEVAGE
jgi:hypothetical protein